MRTHRELLAVPDVAPLLVSSTLGAAAGVGGGLALATLVFSRTGSPLLSAAAVFGPAFGHLLGASLLLSRADRVPPRAALTVLLAAAGLLLAVLARPGLPVVAVVAVVLASGVLGSLQGAVRWGLLSEVLPAQGYLLGRSVVQVVTGAVQVLANALAALALQGIAPTHHPPAGRGGPARRGRPRGAHRSARTAPAGRRARVGGGDVARQPADLGRARRPGGVPGAVGAQRAGGRRGGAVRAVRRHRRRGAVRRWGRRDARR